MKLNYKRTILVGFAFFLICAFWQAYDNTVPKMLTDKFGLSQKWSGAVMALDNLFAVVLLPIFGAVSDRHNGKRGKRTPFIAVGTVAAAAALIGLSVVDKLQLQNIEADAYAVGIENESARLKLAWEATANDPMILAGFMAVLLCALLSMSVFRSPAVALMPDVTPKPLRSKGNAVINLMGAVGGISVLALGIVFGTGKAENAIMSYVPFFAVIAALMLASLVIFLFTVKENKWAAEAEKLNGDVSGEEIGASGERRRLTRPEKVSLFLLLASVVLWYMGYNAVSSKYSVYAGSVLGLDYNTTLMVAQGAAIVSYIPVGIISSKVGRKKTVIAGVVMLGAAFFAASFMTEGSSLLVMNLLFALAGIGWATINVNSYPMVVELASSSDTGKYTGYYYTASMAAQTVTPVLSGVFLDIDMRTLFPYAAIFVGLAVLTMAFVRHGDSKPTDMESVLENIDGV